MLLRFLLLATTVLLLVKTKVKANEDSQKPSKPGPPPPSFVAVVPTSIMGDFDGALFPFLIEETTTTTTTTTPAPFGAAKVDVVTSWVLLGHQAILNCRANAETLEEQLATVLWYRGTKGEPIFTYDARNEAINASIWSEDAPRGFGSRAQFDPKDISLRIDNVQAHEGGLYRCRLDFKRSQTRNVLVNLTVIVPPDPPHILDPNGRRLGSLIGPYDEGESLSITCMSSQGYPLPQLIWTATRDLEGGNRFEVVDPTFETTPEGDATRNTLTVKDLGRDYFGSTFTCLASNNNVTEPVNTNVTIDMRLRPQTVTISPPTEPFSVSRLAVLECRSSGSRPPATITWWKRGKFMGKASEEFLREGTETITRSRIAFHPKPNDHERDVICRAENTNIANSAIESSYKLTIHYPPKVRLSLGSSIDPKAISEGNDVYMDCEIRANPKAYKVEWSHNGLRVESNPSSGVRILAGGKNLVLQGIRRHHSGNYTCTAFNLEGEDTSNPVAITVMFKPECVHQEPVTLGVVPKRDAEVVCRMRALPLPTTFRWTFNNSFEANEVPRHKFTTDGTLSKLNYRAESEKDFGVVHCWAENMLGQSANPCIFTLIPAGPPDAPENCDVHNHTTQGLSVTCQRGFGGGLEQTFHMEVRDRHSGHLLQNLSKTEPIFTVSEFKTSKGVSLSIYSSNSHGRSISQVHLETAPSKVAELQVETSSHGSAGSPHLMIGIIAGLLSTLVILAFLIVVLIKVHTRRHPPPPLNSTFERTTSTNSTAVGNNSSSSTSTNPQRLQNAVKNRKGPFHTSSSSPGSDDPDLIPLQKTKHLGSASQDSQLYCQSGLEARPPPPSLHQHYYSRSQIDIDPGESLREAQTVAMDITNRGPMAAEAPSSATLRMGSNMLAVNPTWSTGSFDEIRNSTATKNLLQMSSSATSNGPLGIHTSVSMVSSNKNSTTAGWPMRLL